MVLRTMGLERCEVGVICFAGALFHRAGHEHLGSHQCSGHLGECASSHGVDSCGHNSIERPVPPAAWGAWRVRKVGQAECVAEGQAGGRGQQSGSRMGRPAAG